MHALIAAGAFVAAHWTEISAGLASLMSLIGTLKALASKHAKVEGALDRVLDVLSFVSRAGAKGLPFLGRLSVPGLPSRGAAPTPDLKLVPPADKEAK